MKLNKDLMSNVLEIPISYFNDIEDNNILMRIRIDFSISKYELMHKMKQYILSKGYISSTIIYSDTVFCRCENYDTGELIKPTPLGNYEFEAFYNAVDYIIKELNNDKLS